MIANALFITIALLPALVFWLMGELKFFIPYKLVLWREYATPSLPTSFTWPLTCLVPPSFSFASSSSRTPGENSPISTNSFTRVDPRCQRLGLKRSPLEMPRGYELEDFLTPREVSEGREPTGEPSSRDQVHYRGRNLTEKVRAGFSIYAHVEDASKLQHVLDQRELTAEILSL